MRVLKYLSDNNRAWAQKMLDRGFLMAPGSLFSPTHAPGTWMRFNVTTLNNPRMLAALDESIAAVRL